MLFKPHKIEEKIKVFYHICKHDVVMIFICIFLLKYEKNISFVSCFNTICEMKTSYGKFILIRESSISHVKYMFRTPRFHMWNFEPVRFTCELSISYMKTFPFHMWNGNFTCESVPIPYVFHKWNSMRKSYSCEWALKNLWCCSTSKPWRACDCWKK